MSDREPTVFVVDDDISVCESLRMLIEGFGWKPETFTSARSFLARPPVDCASCLVLDVWLPDVNGLVLQKFLSRDRTDIPIIFITGRGDIPTTVEAMKGGAAEFLMKPFVPDVLLRAIRTGLEFSRVERRRQTQTRTLRERYNSLSRREHEVMEGVVAGRLNKQVAAVLGISEITVKAHRGRVMRKMHADSIADLVRMATELSAAPQSATDTIVQ